MYVRVHEGLRQVFEPDARLLELSATRLGQQAPATQSKHKPWYRLPEDEQLLLLFDPAQSCIRLWEVEATVTVESTQNGPSLKIKKFKDKGEMTRSKKLKFARRFVVPLLQSAKGTELFANVATGSGLDPNAVATNVYPHRVLIAWANGRERFGANTTLLKKKDRDAASNTKKGAGSIILIDEKAKDLLALPGFKQRPDILLFHELIHARHNQTGTRKRDWRSEERQTIIEENRYRDEIGIGITDVGDRLSGRYAI
jgi:Effector protein